MGKNKIRVWYDEESDILYVSLKEGASVDSEEIEENIRVEFDKKGQAIALEVADITRMLARPLAKQLKEVTEI